MFSNSLLQGETSPQHSFLLQALALLSPSTASPGPLICAESGDNSHVTGEGNGRSQQ